MSPFPTNQTSGGARHTRHPHTGLPRGVSPNSKAPGLHKYSLHRPDCFQQASPHPPWWATTAALRWLQAPEMFMLPLPVHWAMIGNRAHSPGSLTSSGHRSPGRETLLGPWLTTHTMEGSSTRWHWVTSLQLAFQTGHEGNPERPDPASLWGVTSVCPPKP